MAENENNDIVGSVQNIIGRLQTGDRIDTRIMSPESVEFSGQSHTVSLSAGSSYGDVLGAMNSAGITPDDVNQKLIHNTNRNLSEKVEGILQASGRLEESEVSTSQGAIRTVEVKSEGIEYDKDTSGLRYNEHEGKWKLEINLKGGTDAQRDLAVMDILSKTDSIEMGAPSDTAIANMALQVLNNLKVDEVESKGGGIFGRGKAEHALVKITDTSGDSEHTQAVEQILNRNRAEIASIAQANGVLGFDTGYEIADNEGDSSRVFIKTTHENAQDFKEVIGKIHNRFVEQASQEREQRSWDNVAARKVDDIVHSDTEIVGAKEKALGGMRKAREIDVGAGGVILEVASAISGAYNRLKAAAHGAYDNVRDGIGVNSADPAVSAYAAGDEDIPIHLQVRQIEKEREAQRAAEQAAQQEAQNPQAEYYGPYKPEWMANDPSYSNNPAVNPDFKPDPELVAASHSAQSAQPSASAVQQGGNIGFEDVNAAQQASLLPESNLDKNIAELPFDGKSYVDIADKSREIKEGIVDDRISDHDYLDAVGTDVNFIITRLKDNREFLVRDTNNMIAARDEFKEIVEKDGPERVANILRLESENNVNLSERDIEKVIRETLSDVNERIRDSRELLQDIDEAIGDSSEHFVTVSSAVNLDNLLQMQSLVEKDKFEDIFDSNGEERDIGKGIALDWIRKKFNENFAQETRGEASSLQHDLVSLDNKVNNTLLEDKGAFGSPESIRIMAGYPARLEDGSFREGGASEHLSAIVNHGNKITDGAGNTWLQFEKNLVMDSTREKYLDGQGITKGALEAIRTNKQTLERGLSDAIIQRDKSWFENSGDTVIIRGHEIGSQTNLDILINYHEQEIDFARREALANFIWDYHKESQQLFTFKSQEEADFIMGEIVRLNKEGLVPDHIVAEARQMSNYNMSHVAVPEDVGVKSDYKPEEDVNHPFAGIAERDKKAQEAAEERARQQAEEEAAKQAKDKAEGNEATVKPSSYEQGQNAGQSANDTAQETAQTTSQEAKKAGVVAAGAAEIPAPKIINIAGEDKYNNGIQGDAGNIPQGKNAVSGFEANSDSLNIHQAITDTINRGAAAIQDPTVTDTLANTPKEILGDGAKNALKGSEDVASMAVIDPVGAGVTAIAIIAGRIGASVGFSKKIGDRGKHLQIEERILNKLDERTLENPTSYRREYAANKETIEQEKFAEKLAKKREKEANKVVGSFKSGHYKKYLDKLPAAEKQRLDEHIEARARKHVGNPDLFNKADTSGKTYEDHLNDRREHEKHFAAIGMEVKKQEKSDKYVMGKVDRSSFSSRKDYEKEVERRTDMQRLQVRKSTSETVGIAPKPEFKDKVWQGMRKAGTVAKAMTWGHYKEIWKDPQIAKKHKVMAIAGFAVTAGLAATGIGGALPVAFTGVNALAGHLLEWRARRAQKGDEVTRNQEARDNENTRYNSYRERQNAEYKDGKLGLMGKISRKLHGDRDSLRHRATERLDPISHR